MNHFKLIYKTYIYDKLLKKTKHLLNTLSTCNCHLYPSDITLNDKHYKKETHNNVFYIIRLTRNINRDINKFNNAKRYDNILI
jgi:hypothetical protein